MLWKASAIKEYKIQASDGEIGTVKDLLFDDKSWIGRWIVVDTGPWLFGRKVLLPVSVLGKPDHDLRHLTIHLTKQQVKDSPSIDSDLPVSRQIEAHIYNHYGQMPYWYGGILPMGLAAPGATIFTPEQGLDVEPRSQSGTGDMADNGDPHLRSIVAITNYHVKATDGEIGHAEEFLFDDDNWQIRYIMVDTENWFPGLEVVISPLSIRNIEWTERLIYLNVDISKVKTSPPYDPKMTQDGKFHERFHAHFWPTLRESDETLNSDL